MIPRQEDAVFHAKGRIRSASEEQAEAEVAVTEAEQKRSGRGT